LRIGESGECALAGFYPSIETVIVRGSFPRPIHNGPLQGVGVGLDA